MTKIKTVTQRANQEVIANKAYELRLGNGAMNTGDGWKYRGRGFIQVTGKGQYVALVKEYHNYWSDDCPDFLLHPEKMKDFPNTVRSAVWYWCHNKLYKLADAGVTDAVVDSITSIVNHDTDTYEEREANFSITYAAFR